MTTRLLTAAALLLLAAPAAFAQQSRYANPAGSYGPYARPALSPYLNMIRGGDPAANYYLGVVPERERRALNVQFGSELQDLEQRTSAPAAGEREPAIPELPVTGHPSYFLNYSTYYNLGGAPGRTGLTAPAPPPAPRRSR